MPESEAAIASSLVMAAPAGRRLTSREKEILAEGSVGHLVLFPRNLRDPEEAKDLIAEARSLLPRPPLVAVDQEGGIVCAAAAIAGRPPSAMHLGAAGSERAVREWAARQASLLRRVGINMNLAPVLDVEDRGGSAVIGTRSFGGDPKRVARLGAAAVRGYLRGGVLPVGKHFPGHGSVRSDSHLTLPIDRRGARAILGSSIPPFRSAFRAGLPAVMIAHVAYPALGTGALPAGLSESVIRGLLRERLGFRGVVMSDAVEMAGFPGETFLPEALAAGVDLFCVTRSLAAGRRASRRLAEAIRSGRVDPRAARAAARRVRALAGRRLHRPAGGAAVRADPARGIVWAGPGSFRPLPEGDWVAFLPEALPGRIRISLDLSGIDERFGERFRREAVHLFPADPSGAECRAVAREAGRAEAVVLGLLARGELPAGQSRLLRLLMEGRRRLVAVALADPEPLLRIRGVERLFAFDFGRDTLSALFEILDGRKRPLGISPFGRR
ncbi:MAG: glycoside hydrolase family 3 protein [Candidatus Eisenbacteria bacterium]|nr:glycoside hydrolase family 3 protein [Candidatus Eisenbacteria bacterium]